MHLTLTDISPLQWNFADGLCDAILDVEVEVSVDASTIASSLPAVAFPRLSRDCQALPLRTDFRMKRLSYNRNEVD
jgi:hypothetical protein